jgi:hypothetical protein
MTNDSAPSYVHTQAAQRYLEAHCCRCCKRQPPGGADADPGGAGGAFYCFLRLFF